MAYTDIDDPSAYFQTALYTGNGGTIDVVNDGNSDLQPDWLWFKCRSNNTDHGLQDSVRGTALSLQSNTNSADADVGTSQITAFGSDGFSLAAGGDVNTNNRTYACWQWKAGTSFTNDASSTSVGTIDSAGSVNTDAGFSIITYTGTGANGTVAHGLGVAPKMVIIKKRSGTDNWIVYHKNLSAVDRYVMLDTTDGESANSAAFNDTHPTSSVFSLGSFTKSNGDGNTFVAYCFAEKQGYSKFGKYIGNGNADGAFVYTGFKPAFIMIKFTGGDGQDWFILDSKRSPFNLVDDSLSPSAPDAESTSEANLDFLSNGFKLKMTSVRVNANGSPYIFMAFAENPFVTSTGTAGTAR